MIVWDVAKHNLLYQLAQIQDLSMRFISKLVLCIQLFNIILTEVND